jgi:hypothetical protein
LSKYGTFVGKGYNSGGLFRLSFHDTCNKSMNTIVSNKSNISHSRVCHINFGCLAVSKCKFNPKIDLVKGSECQVCVQSKQPCKPHKAAKARNLAPLDLIYSNLCEMNEILTKGGK